MKKIRKILNSKQEVKSIFNKWFYKIIFAFLASILIFAVGSGIVNASNFGSANDFISGVVNVLLKIFMTLFKTVAKPILDALQDSIFYLLEGSFIFFLFKVNYEFFILVSIILFVTLVLLYSLIAVITHNTSGIFFKLLQSITLFIMMPMIFLGAFALVSGITYYITGSYLSDQSISSLIFQYTFDLADSSISSTVQLTLNVCGFFTSIFVIKNLLSYSFLMANRVFEIFGFGILGICFAAPASVSDGGKKLTTYNSIMSTKLLSGLLCFVLYLLITNSLPFILSWISSHDIKTKYSSVSIFKAVVICSLIVGSFMILQSLSTEIAFVVSGNKTGALATQLGAMRGIANDFLRPAKTFQKLGLNKLKAAKALGFAGIKANKSPFSAAGIAKTNNVKSKLHNDYLKRTSGLFGEDKLKAEKEWLEQNSKKINKINEYDSTRLNAEELTKQHGIKQNLDN